MFSALVDPFSVRTVDALGRLWARQKGCARPRSSVGFVTYGVNDCVDRVGDSGGLPSVVSCGAFCRVAQVHIYCWYNACEIRRFVFCFTSFPLHSSYIVLQSPYVRRSHMTSATYRAVSMKGSSTDWPSTKRMTFSLWEAPRRYFPVYTTLLCGFFLISSYPSFKRLLGVHGRHRYLLITFLSNLRLLVRPLVLHCYHLYVLPVCVLRCAVLPSVSCEVSHSGGACCLPPFLSVPIRRLVSMLLSTVF